MTENNLENRMYVLVNRSLAPLNKGIQALHAVVEYGQKYSDTFEYIDWATTHKTVIVLDGGTSNESVQTFIDNSAKYLGDMENHLNTLKEEGINVSKFNEPDVNCVLSAVAFIVDERVYDKEKYPDMDLDLYESVGADPTGVYDNFEKMLGGKKNVFLREFLSQFNLTR